MSQVRIKFSAAGEVTNGVTTPLPFETVIRLHPWHLPANFSPNPSSLSLWLQAIYIPRSWDCSDHKDPTFIGGLEALWPVSECEIAVLGSIKFYSKAEAWCATGHEWIQCDGTSGVGGEDSLWVRGLGKASCKGVKFRLHLKAWKEFEQTILELEWGCGKE